MAPLFKKLNRVDQTPIVLLDAPSSFKPESRGPSGTEIVRPLKPAQNLTFALAFVLDRSFPNKLKRHTVGLPPTTSSTTSGDTTVSGGAHIMPGPVAVCPRGLVSSAAPAPSNAAGSLSGSMCRHHQG